MILDDFRCFDWKSIVLTFVSNQYHTCQVQNFGGGCPRDITKSKFSTRINILSLMDSYYYGWAPPNPYRGWKSAVGMHQNSKKIALEGLPPAPSRGKKLHTSFDDSLDMFEPIFTDLGFSWFLCTSPLMGFSSPIVSLWNYWNISRFR